MIATIDSEARQFAALHPTRDGKTWSMYCGSLMWRMCEAYGVTPVPIPSSAKLAGDAAGTLNTNSKIAPIGAFHYWTYGADGHVGLDTKGGGTDVFMASKCLRESLGDCIGFQSVEGYTRKGDFPYRGWSKNYGKNGIILPPSMSIAMKYWIDNGVLDSNGDLNRNVDIETLCWFMYKAIGKMQEK